ncbi:MAG TPA: Gldg family protein [Allosphingosinicella sp.]
MTTTAPSPRRPSRASRAAALAAAAAALPLLLPGQARACNEAVPAHFRHPVMLMTGLPLVWGERGPFEPGSRPAAAYVELSKDFDFRPVDVLGPATLAKGRLLFLAQPKRLAPAELAALDAWVRSGGRALILTDPMLTWPSELPLGDIRRPPPAGLLSPLLDHWGMTLEAPGRPGVVEARWGGRPIRFDSPGRFRSTNPDCEVDPEGWKALCQFGPGKVTLVADADLLRDSLWASGKADNAAVIAEWLDQLAQLSRPRPRPAGAGGHRSLGGALILAVLAAAAGIGLLRRRRPAL